VPALETRRSSRSSKIPRLCVIENPEFAAGTDTLHAALFFRPPIPDMLEDFEVSGGDLVRLQTVRKQIQRVFEVRHLISGRSEARWRTG
jgi:hypothetical protein